MGKICKPLSYHVRVEPWRRGSGLPPDLEDEQRICEEIVKDIARHVDGVGYHGVEVIEEAEDICEFCGSGWTKGDSSHNGGCCERDAEMMEGVIIEEAA